MANNGTSVWTDEKVDALRLRWSAGEPCRQIGAALGMSRSAIIGKAHRLGLPARREMPRMNADDRREKDKERYRIRDERRRANKQQGEEAMIDATIVEQISTPLVPETMLPFSLLRNISTRNSNQCRYVPGSGPLFIACGAETAPGESWCERCNDIVHDRPHISPERRAALVAQAKCESSAREIDRAD